MTNRVQLRKHIGEALGRFGEESVLTSSFGLLNALGYSSDRTLKLNPNTFDGFARTFISSEDNFRSENALVDQWKSVDVLFQITDDDIGRSRGLFGSSALEEERYDSFLFLSIGLVGTNYTRADLANITREVNKCFDSHAIILFTYNRKLSISVIERREHKREDDRNVLEKVTLIKDIDVNSPHRAHLDILSRLTLDVVQEEKKHPPRSFEALFAAWEEVLDTREVNKTFYRELASWFYWADQHPNLKFPKDNPDNKTGLIRLITRLIFVWFLKEKGLVTDDLFNKGDLKTLLNNFDAQNSKDSTYYQAILQNLFFATLSTPMRRDDPNGRRFVDEHRRETSSDEDNRNIYRYASSFAEPHVALALFDRIPFLNGGMFECLDRAADKDQGIPAIYVDGFSLDPKERAYIPNELFFGEERAVTLDYEGRDKRYKVEGIIELLQRYKFTVAENTPIEEEVALDPELLGQVFENLLAAYNPETETTARKQTGSFYTPRVVVDYMVDESLIAHLYSRLSNGQSRSMRDPDDLGARLRHLVSYTDEQPKFAKEDIPKLVDAIDMTRVIDPACGSGAFPMGVLQKLVYVLNKLDPNNEIWKVQQREREIGQEITRIRKDQQTAHVISDDEAREQAEKILQKRLKEINDAFDSRYADPDYARKLFLIENCIYGVDIQPIAMQIAKLRFFISLIIEQNSNESAPNLGIKSLPNLETKFVVANVLLKLTDQPQIKPTDVYTMEEQRKEIRHQHFLARTQQQKQELREQDKRLLKTIARSLRESGFRQYDAQTLSSWDPYDQNQAAGFFDLDLMFGLEDGFDIVIGNPPYVRHEAIKHLKPHFKKAYDCYTGTADLYVYFFEQGITLLRPGGILTYICSNKYFRSNYGEKLRAYMTENTSLQILIDFGDAPVFTAIAYPSILLTQRVRPSNKTKVRVLSWNFATAIEQFRTIFETSSFVMPQASLVKEGWSIESTKVLELLETVRKVGMPLEKYVNGRLRRGILTGLNEAFVIDRDTHDRLIEEDDASAEVLKPFLRGRDVKRWQVEYQNLWLIFTRRGVDIDNYPAIKSYLHQHKDQLTPGVQGGRKSGSYEWYEIQDNVAYWQEFEQPKIVIPAIAQDVNYALDTYGYYSNDKTSICVTERPKYLLGLLNSKLLWWLIQKSAASRQGGFFEFKPMYVSQLRIATPLPDAEVLIDTLVDYLLYLSTSKTSNSRDQVMIRFFEQLIDAVVYELYIPNKLHEAKRYPIETLRSANLPLLTENTRLQDLRNLFEQLFDKNHPVRKLIFFLDSIEEIRIIEGREEGQIVQDRV